MSPSRQLRDRISKRKPLIIKAKQKTKASQAKIALRNSTHRASRTRATRKKNNLKLLDILKLITAGLIVLPSFQRDGSWNAEARKKLLNFMINGTSFLTPIAINKLVSSTMNGEYAEVDLKRTPISSEDMEKRVADHQAKGEDVFSLIDGLQRLSTLLMCVLGSPEVKDLFYDLHLGEFVIKPNPRPHHIHVHEIMTAEQADFRRYKQDFLQGVEDLATRDEYDMVIDRIRQDLLNYEIGALETTGLDLIQEVEWFIQLNDSGVNLSKIQVNVSALAANGFKFLTYISEFKDVLHGAAFHDLMTKTSTQVSIPTTGFTVPMEILAVDGDVTKHTANYSPIPSDEKSGQWKKTVTPSTPMSVAKMEVDKARMIGRAAVEALKVAVAFWDRNLSAVPLTETHDSTDPTRFRTDHVMYAHGYIMWKAARVFLDYMDPETEVRQLSESDFTLSRTDEASLLQWMQGANFHNQDNDRKRQMFTDLIHNY